ncbi:MAG: helix-turn-helix transcriptional regulator [Patescibacteria group bacterium]|jgi:DNA-binding XRE family transcriptional regulator
MESYKSFKSDILKNPEVKKYYNELGPEFAIISMMIRSRLKNGLTQADLAKKIGTKQSAISRFESGTYNPTITFLYKIADALDAKMEITIS